MLRPRAIVPLPFSLSRRERTHAELDHGTVDSCRRPDHDGWSYTLAATAYAVVALAHRFGHGATLRAISPATLTPLVMMFGLFVGFLAADVWPSFERARAAADQEAMALREAVLLAEALPPEARANLHAAVRAHITYAVKAEWPAMAIGGETLRRLPRELMHGTMLLLALTPTQPGHRLAQERALSAIERALDARRQRIQLSQVSVGAIKWLVVITLAALIQLTIAMLHVDSRAASLITMFLFGTAVAASMLLIMAYDQPFSTGGVRVLPTALQDVMPD